MLPSSVKKSSVGLILFAVRNQAIKKTKIITAKMMHNKSIRISCSCLTLHSPDFIKYLLYIRLQVMINREDGRDWAQLGI